MTVITRFAPSPTGYLHIGGARTALFNYLFAKHYNGKFLLRIEDTDRVRSTKEATEAIFDSLKWLNLNWDDEAIFQYSRSDIHKKIALQLVEEKKAYFCFSSQDEIEESKAAAKDENLIFKSPWRDADPSTYPVDIKPVVRIKVPLEGETIIRDRLQGDIKIKNKVLDDMVLLRSDLTPTYMLAVVVDDHDMGITHIIRGDDHLTNAARQLVLYQALGWVPPEMIHIPLIYGSDGTKLSKRRGALGVENYREMGFLHEALCNYLLRLGWGHGDDEIIPRSKAIEWFDIEGLNKSPARLDLDKMRNLNAHYLKNMENEKLTQITLEALGKREDGYAYISILKAMDSIKNRAILLTDLAKLGAVYLPLDINYTKEATEIIASFAPDLKEEVIRKIANLSSFNKENIQILFKEIAMAYSLPLGKLMQPVRAIITGEVNFASVFELIEIIGKEETLKRLAYQVS